MVKHRSLFWATGLLGLVLVLGVTAVFTIRARSVHAAPLAPATFTCSPDLVVSANVRVVAHCPTGFFVDATTSVFWFAYPTSDSANASRMLSLFETAKATGSTITFYFDTADLSGASYGCLTTNCRAYLGGNHAMSTEKIIQHISGRVKLAAALILLAGLLLGGILASPIIPVQALNVHLQITAPHPPTSSGVNGTLASFTALIPNFYTIDLPFLAR